MEPPALTDNELLSDWLEHGREPSFHALVSRYTTLVHMAALRSCGNNDTLAAEAAQLTFILLARKARSLSTRRSLAGWLHLTAVMQVKNLVRQTRRETRKRQQLLSHMETGTDASPDSAAAWREMRPVLDRALAALSAKDRETLLLRFYRSLSVREIAATLGIATDAAQKRLNRATARLRARLIRCGCQANGLLAGTPLTTVLLAGFAADSQAAAGPAASLLASQALSASTAATATGGVGISILAKLTALKTTSLIPPAIALLLAAGWLVPKYRALASLENENLMLERRLTAAHADAAQTSSARQSQNLSAKVMPPQKAGALNWRELAALFANVPADDLEASARRTHAELLIKQRVPLLSKEELADALDQVLTFKETLEPDAAERLSLPLDILLTNLIAKDSQFALSRFVLPLNGAPRSGFMLSKLSDALGAWAKTDPAAAVQWFDQAIASGAFDSKTLSGENLGRVLFESELMRGIFHSDPAKAANRLQALSEGQRKMVLYNNSSWVGAGDQARFISLTREQLTGENEAAVIARLAVHQHDRERRRTQEGNAFSIMESIMDSMRVTQTERAACARFLTESEISGQIFRDGIRVENVDEFRIWIKTQAPADADRIAGEILGGIAGQPKQMSLKETAALASQYDQESGGQEVLASLLESAAAADNRETARELAAAIHDPSRRERILKHLEK